MIGRVIPMSPSGPIDYGLQPCQLIPAERILSGYDHRELMHTYFESSNKRFSAGVWESTPCADRCDYDVDEACFLISGSVRIVAETGEEWIFGTGDCFVIEKGFRGTWETLETVRKFFFIHQT